MNSVIGIDNSAPKSQMEISVCANSPTQFANGLLYTIASFGSEKMILFYAHWLLILWDVPELLWKDLSMRALMFVGVGNQ